MGTVRLAGVQENQGNIEAEAQLSTLPSKAPETINLEPELAPSHVEVHGSFCLVLMATEPVLPGFPYSLQNKPRSTQVVHCIVCSHSEMHFILM